MRQPYQKPALTLDEQIEYLRNKGMMIANEAWAKERLLHISYYRLSAYWLPFEYPKHQQRADHCIQPGTSLKTVIALHEFDRGLRRLVLDAIEAAEISVRGNWAYQMAILGDGHSYLDPAHYANTAKFTENCRRLNEEARTSKERFMVHYRGKYDRPEPPVWMAAEILSFGSLSHWYANLSDRAVRQAIAQPYGLDERVFKTLLHHLSVVRNICAHHSRLWNRNFTVSLALPRRPIELNGAVNRAEPKKLYNTLTLLLHVLECIGDITDWPSRLKAHLATLPHGDLSQLGFPGNWETRAYWVELDL